MTGPFERRLTAVLIGALSLGFSGSAAAVKVKIRGSSSIEARAVVSPIATEIRGRLTDDAGRPIGEERVRLRWLDGQTPRRLTEVVRCGSTPHVHSARNDLRLPDEDVVDTDPSGRFCARWLNPAPGGAIELEFEGDDYYSGIKTSVDVDSSRRSLTLYFSPEPQKLSLDRASHTLWVETQAEPAFGADEDTSPIQLELTFTGHGESTRPLARASVRPGERAELAIASDLLGEPGPGTLVVRFAGSDAIQPSERSIVVQRTARVSLSLAGRIARADPQSGVEVRVAVGSAQGAVPNGSIEARLGGDSVGAAPVAAGAGRLVAVFEAPHGGEVPLSLHYLPAAPWWEPGDPLQVLAPVSAPNPWRRLPWLLAAVAIGAWVVRGWRRPPRTEKKGDRTSMPAGRASLEVVQLGPARSGWKGRVLDAHDGTPIAGARVAVLVPAFGGDGVAAQATTDETGSFELTHVARVEGAHLEASARWHATFAKGLPPAGQVSINLVTRRRALLERLVEWATRRGVPWKTVGDATPGHVVRLGRRRRAEDVVRWAEAVEQAAFGPEPPDETREQSIRAREPRWSPDDT
jgi:hypothetical protein